LFFKRHFVLFISKMLKKKAIGEKYIRVSYGLKKVVVKEDVASKKRSLTPSKEIADEKLPKRQKVSSINELLLENKYLKLEIKYLNELYTKANDALKLATGFNRYLETENSRLRKENKNFGSGSGKYGGRDKSDIDRRALKFPWLPIYKGEVRKAESKQCRKENVGWEDLPSAVAFFILDFLGDEDLFIFRGINTQFYEAFYSQNLRVDWERVLWLAKKGRKFKNLKYLCIKAEQELTRSDLRALNRLNFPELEALVLNKFSNLKFIGPHHNLRELCFIAQESDDLMYISDRKFPALQILISQQLNSDVSIQLEELKEHASLKFLGFCNWEPSVAAIRHLTKAKFPKLTAVGVSGTEVTTQLLDSIKQQGLEFIDELELYYYPLETQGFLFSLLQTSR